MAILALTGSGGSPWPAVAAILAVVLVLVVLALIFIGSERLTRRLTRNRLPDRDDEGDSGAGPLVGMQGLIARGEGDDLAPRERGR
jgi:flagellar biosynthesis/type III secretory pathway M-ring protein FliF/YscJ